MRKRGSGQRVLAIDPTTRGFGFVILEGADRLVDWGLRDIRDDKEQQTIEKLDDLICLYKPSILVVEDIEDPTSRRSPRIEAIIRSLRDLAIEKALRVRSLAPSKVRACFARSGATTKHQIAGVICGRFPELRLYRPPRRQLWMSEDERMAIFDAASLAATFFAWCE